MKTMKNIFALGKMPVIITVLILFSKIINAQIPSTLPTKSQLTSLEIKNTSQYIKKGKYKWKVYIDAAPNVLNSIKKVQYTLHPTFKDTLVAGNPKDKFSYRAIGWGEFALYINIYYKNNRYERLRYWLKLY